MADRTPIIMLEYHVGTYPQYAILSHRWGPPSDEVSFQDLQNNPSAAREKIGYRKVEQCCIKALEMGLRHAWIDTCCIDKSSSAELSEAINSMYAWYRDAEICFAYLEDVSVTDSDPKFEQQFKASSWFTRGWTLQELLAPSKIRFFTGDWCRMEAAANMSSLNQHIQEITSIPHNCLYDRRAVSRASVAKKMSWASKRVTTRVEDEAYCLMGLFGVHIPIIYGEGRNAFQRLQEEIMKTTQDHTILAWSDTPASHFGYHLSVLAECPAQFLGSANYVPVDIGDFDTKYGPGEPGYTMTNLGLHIDLPICPLPSGPGGLFLAFIACELGLQTDGCKEVCLVLQQRPDRPDGHFFRIVFNERPLIYSSRNITSTLITSTRRGRLWISARVEGLIHTPMEFSSHRLNCVKFRGISFNGKTPPLMDRATELRPSKFVALAAAFQGGYDYHEKQMHMLFAAMGIHNGSFWYYFDEKKTEGLEMGAAEELHEKLDEFGPGKSDLRPDVQGKVRLVQWGPRTEDIELTSGPCNCFTVHMNDVLRYESVILQVHGDASVQWVEVKISDEPVKRHRFISNGVRLVHAWP